MYLREDFQPLSAVLETVVRSLGRADLVSWKPDCLYLSVPGVD